MQNILLTMMLLASLLLLSLPRFIQAAVVPLSRSGLEFGSNSLVNITAFDTSLAIAPSDHFGKDGPDLDADTADIGTSNHTSHPVTVSSAINNGDKVVTEPEGGLNVSFSVFGDGSLNHATSLNVRTFDDLKGETTYVFAQCVGEQSMGIIQGFQGRTGQPSAYPRDMAIDPAVFEITIADDDAAVNEGWQEVINDLKWSKFTTRQRPLRLNVVSVCSAINECPETRGPIPLQYYFHIDCQAAVILVDHLWHNTDDIPDEVLNSNLWRPSDILFLMYTRICIPQPTGDMTYVSRQWPRTLFYIAFQVRNKMDKELISLFYNHLSQDNDKLYPGYTFWLHLRRGTGGSDADQAIGIEKALAVLGSHYGLTVARMVYEHQNEPSGLGGEGEWGKVFAEPYRVDMFRCGEATSEQHPSAEPENLCLGFQLGVLR